MSSKFGFLRKFIALESTDEIKEVFTLLNESGVEIFVFAGEKGQFRNMADAEDASPDNIYYVPAADYDAAVAKLPEHFTSKVLPPEQPEGVKSELEIAEEKLAKKRKWMHIEAIICIIIGIILMLIKRG